MKTITRTFYVNDNCMDDLKSHRSFDYRYFSTSQSMDNENQIQISWQEPEKKIEITESDCVARLMKHNWYSKEDAEFICSRIFGAENEL